MSSIASVLSKLSLITLITLILVSSTIAFGQGGNINRQVIAPTVSNGGTGQPVPFANITVCPSTATGSPCSPLTPTLYSDPALQNLLANPTAADVNGNYSFFLPTGTYLVQESAPVGAGYSFTYSWLWFINGTGTVSSVALAMPSIFSVSGSPCTLTCSFSVGLVSESALTVFGNCTGSTAVPSFCTITSPMIPSTLNATTINGLTVTGNETVSGTLGVTGATTLSSTLLVSGSATLSSTLAVTGNETIGGTLAVSGSSTLTGSVNTSTSLATPLLTLNGSQSLIGTQGTGGSKIATASGSWTNADLLCSNATFDIIDCGPKTQTLATDGTVTSVSANTTAQQVMKTYQFGAGVLNGVGKTFRLTASVGMQPSGAGPPTSSVYFGFGTSAALGTYTESARQTTSNSFWFDNLQWDCITVTAGAAGALSCAQIPSVIITGGGTAAPIYASSAVTLTPVNLTVPLYIGMACSFSAGSASNICTESLEIVEQLL